MTVSTLVYFDSFVLTELAIYWLGRLGILEDNEGAFQLVFRIRLWMPIISVNPIEF